MYRLHLNTGSKKDLNNFQPFLYSHGGPWGKKRVILHKKWEIFVRFGLQLLITVYKVLITDLRASNTLSRTFGDRPE